MIHLIIFCLLAQTLADQLFAGNGLVTYSYDILHPHNIYIMNCTTYDDCYELLCDFLSDPIYVVQVQPRQWNGNCDDLNPIDFRLMWADFDAYHNSIFNNTYETKTNSEASIILCLLGKNTSLNFIYYDNLDCELSH